MSIIVKAETVGNRTFVVVKLEGKTEDVLIASFEFPWIDTDYFSSFILGMDSEEQNDDGFYMKLKDGIVTFEIEPNTDGGNYKPVKICVPYEACGTLFEDLRRACEEKQNE
jgi:hypothetical protein